MYVLRPYQNAAVQATLKYFRRHRAPAVIVLPTGAGKSLVIAELARIARGRVLVLAHVKELVEQNHQKYESYGLRAGIYSAGLERKDTRDKVIFGSIQSVARAPAEFFKDFSLLVVDECHRISTSDGTQYLEVIQQVRENHPQVCILGFTATPYRLDTGWIYQYHHEGALRSESERIFYLCIYEVTLGYMIKEGYLTQPVKIDSPVASYDFSELFDRFGNSTFPEVDLERVLKDQRRVTPGIVNNIVEISADRRGVMIFTATVSHAREVFSLLPESVSALVLGSTAPEERDAIIARFKNEEIKFLVNVSVLTTGFDAPHVDVIALLRPTESVSLYQQIVGRGLRLSPGKEDCLILDYTGVEHEIFRPEIGFKKPSPSAVGVIVSCPECSHDNSFWGECDGSGEVVEHYGERCQGVEIGEDLVTIKRCGFRFRARYCDICGTENDLTARICSACNNAILSDEQRLQQARADKNTHVMRPDSMTFQQSFDKQGRVRLEVRYYDYDGEHLAEYFYFATDNDTKVFYYNFLRMHNRTPELRLIINSPADALKEQSRFRIPLFVIAERQGRLWRIREKIFR